MASRNETLGLNGRQPALVMTKDGAKVLDRRRGKWTSPLARVHIQTLTTLKILERDHEQTNDTLDRIDKGDGSGRPLPAVGGQREADLISSPRNVEPVLRRLLAPEHLPRGLKGSDGQKGRHKFGDRVVRRAAHPGSATRRIITSSGPPCARSRCPRRSTRIVDKRHIAGGPHRASPFASTEQRGDASLRDASTLLLCPTSVTRDDRDSTNAFELSAGVDRGTTWRTRSS